MSSPLSNVKLHLVETLENAQEFLTWFKSVENKPIGVDSESTGFFWHRDDYIRMIQVGDHEHGWALRWDRWSGLFEAAMKQHTGPIDMMNSKFDYAFLRRAGVELDKSRIRDVGVMSHILEPHMSRALKNQAKRHVDPQANALQYQLDEAIGAHGGWTWATVPYDFQPYWCVPKTTEILTRSGWKKWSDVETTVDETLGYEDGELRWTPVTGVNTPGVAPIVRFGNSYWSTTCTPNHRWVMQKNDVVGIYPLNEGWSLRKSNTKLIRSALAEGGKSSLTPDEAAVLAWVLSDGHFTWQRPQTQSSPWVAIGQSIKKYANEVRDLLKRTGAYNGEWIHPRCVDAPNPVIRFNVNASYFTKLWEKADLAKYGTRSSAFKESDISLIELVTSLSVEARAAWNNAWYMAEGDKRSGRSLAQNRGAKLDAIMLSMYMDGYAIYGGTYNSDRKCVHFTRSRRNPTPQKTTVTPAGLADVWCPTTASGTWTARDKDGNIFVTGNSYAALDPVLTRLLAEHHLPLVQAQAPAAYDLENAFQWVALDMETLGTPVDVAYARENYDKFTAYCDEVEKWCWSEYRVKPGSNAAVVKILAEAGFEFSKATKSGAVALDKDVLDGIDHPLAQAVLKRRQLQKIASTYLHFYIENADADGRIHPSINTLGARTSRMSMAEPNFQNLPVRGGNPAIKVVRNCVRARPGYTLVFSDFDQIEMRGLAIMSGDSGLIAAFNSPEDFFVNLARTVFQDSSIEKSDPRRAVTKNVGYGKVYGAGVTKLAQTAGIPQQQASWVNSTFDAAYPEVKNFSQRIFTEAMQRLHSEGVSYTTCPLTGRRHVADRGKEYALVNYTVQGWAAALLKTKLLEASMAGLDEFMILPVHDEVILEVPNNQLRDVVHTLHKVMNDSEQFSVPISASVAVGERWGEKREWEDE